MPQLGESVTEGTIGKWLKQVGDAVAKYDPLVEVITDKVNAEIPSDFEGTLTEIVVEEGTTVRVGTVICRVEEAGGSAGGQETATEAPTVSKAEPTEASDGVTNAPSMRTPNPPHASAAVVAPTPAMASGRPAGRFSPAVLKLADEHGVDLARVSGSGEGGRITRKDVLAYVERSSAGEGSDGAPSQQRGAASSAVTGAGLPAGGGASAANPLVARAADADEEILEPSAIRKTIARRMLESKQTAPHAWTMMEADVTRLQQFRDVAKVDFKRKEGVDLTYLPFFIKAVVEALKQYPMVNASWVDGQIHLKRRIHISIAVATDDALTVPVIHDADRLSIAGLAHAANELAARARSGRLSLDDVQGGTFTVNNTGAFGSVLSQPILNAPQAAILSFESIVKRPVVVNDAIAIRSMLNLCLSLDHRLLDGWIAGQFLKAVKERLQSFGSETVLY